MNLTEKIKQGKRAWKGLPPQEQKKRLKIAYMVYFIMSVCMISYLVIKSINYGTN